MTERVRIWRPAGGDRLLAMHGITTGYAIEPDGTYVFGLVVRGAFRATRGRARHDVRAGDVVAWDPWTPHRGRASDGAPWEARLVMIELPDLVAALAEPHAASADIEPPRPVVHDPGLAARFAALHREMERPSWALERELALAAWLRDVIGTAERDLPDRRRAARADPALRRACEYLGDNLDRNVTLEELAAASGVSRFRVARLFRAGLGLPPHRFQLAHRLRLARRLLERGADPSEAAAHTGFFDQSHLHRHFVRTIGMTPARYAAAFGSRR
jgi:AraC-like DNA-binding protein